MTQDNGKIESKASTSIVPVTVKTHPLKDDIVEAKAKAGQTLYEVLGDIRENVVVFYNGETVSHDKMDDIILRENDVISAAVVAQGGEGNKTLRTVLQIAVVAASLAVDLILPGAGRVLQAAAAAAIQIGGNLLIDALVPPSQMGIDQGNPEGFDRIGGITGSRNAFTPYAPVPRVYGRHKIYPLMSAKPYTEIESNVQYLHMLLCVGYGPVRLYNPKIGDTVIGSFDENNNFTSNDNFENVQIDVGENPKYYTNDVDENAVSVTMNNKDDVAVRTTAPGADKAGIDFIFPQGLFGVDDEGETFQRNVQFKIEYREAGTTDPWINPFEEEQAHTWVNRDGRIEQGSRTYEHVVFEGDERETLRDGVNIEFPERGQYDIRVERITGSNPPEDYAYFDECTWTTLRTITYEEPTDMPGVVQIGFSIRATDQVSGVIDNFSVEVESRLATYDGTSWDEPTFDPETGDGSGGALTSNPAWIYADVLTGSANKRAIDKSELDADSIKDWADWCDANGLTYNSPGDARNSVFEIAKSVAAAGRASWSIQDGKWTVVQDIEKTVPRQVFTPRNTWGFSASRSFPEIPHAIKVRFIDPDNEWQENERIVYDDGYDEQSATRFETLELVGVTDKDQAWKMGRYYLANMRLRPEIYTFDVDVEHVTATRGDLVKFAHDVPLYGIAQGRIKSVTTNGDGDVTEITVDEPCLMESDKNYMVTIRSDEDMAVQEAVDTEAGNQTTLALSTPIPASKNVDKGDIYAFGESQKEVVDLIITKIQTRENLNAKITAVDAAPDIHDADTGTIPSYDSQITAPTEPNQVRPPAPTIQNIRSSETTSTKDGDGSYPAKLVIAYDVAKGFPSLKVEARYSRESTKKSWKGNAEAEAASGTISLTGVEVGKSYYVQVRAITENGMTSEWVEAGPHAIEGKQGAPNTPTGLTVNLDKVHLRAEWDSNPETDIEEYEIRKGSDWDSGTVIAKIKSTEITMAVTTTGSQTYWLKAIDTAGNYSSDAASYTINVPDDWLDDVARKGGEELFSSLELNSGNPYVDYIETDLADKNWRTRALGGDYVVEERDDGNNIVATPVTFKAGAPSDSIVVYSDRVNIGSALTVGGGLTSGMIASFHGDIDILGDIEVGGTINYVNEDNLQVEDKTITVNKNGTDGSADGAGLIVERPSGNQSILWDSSDGFLFSDKISVDGLVVNGTNIFSNGGVQALGTGDNARFSEIRADDIDDISEGPTMRFPSNSGIAEGSGSGDTEIDRLYLYGRNDVRVLEYDGTEWIEGVVLSGRGRSNFYHGINIDGDKFVDSGSNLTANKGDFLDLLTVHDDIDPDVGYTSNIGSATKKFLTAHIAELRVSTLVSAEERVTTGGRFLVGQSTELTSAVGSGDGSIEVKHNNLGSGDIVQLEAGGQLEFMEITSSDSGSGPYTYSVNRDLDGTGANSWEAGDAVFNTGQSGEGFLDLFAVNSITQNTSTSGPTIAHMVRTGSSYNDIEERAVSGNLKGFYGIGSDTWGFGAGDPDSEHIIVDPDDGVSIFSGSNLAMQINSDLLSIGNLEYTVSTDTLVAGGWTIASTAIQNGSDIVLDASNKKISLNNGSMEFGYGIGPSSEHGIEVNSNVYLWDNGDYKLGNSTNYIEHDGTYITVKAGNALIGQTAGWLGADDIFSYSSNQVTASGWTFDTDRFSSSNNNIEIFSDNGYNGEINVNGDYWRGNTSFQFGGPDGITKSASGATVIGSDVDIFGNLDVSSLPRVSDEGLIALYRFDNSLINSVEGKVGETNGSFNYVEGVSNKAVEFTGSGNTINTGLKNDDLFINGEATFCFSFTPLEYPGANKVVLSVDDGGGERSWDIRFDENSERISLWSAGSFFGSTTPSYKIDIGETVFVVARIKENDEAEIIVRAEDGTVSSSKTSTSSADDVSVNMWINSRGGGGSGFSFQMDEFRIYTRLISDREIKSLFLYPAGNSQGIISANQLRTGRIESTNLSTSSGLADVGTLFDLDDGILSMGFDGNNIFHFDSKDETATIAKWKITENSLIADGGQITNSNNDFIIDEDGISLYSGDTVGRKISFLQSGEGERGRLQATSQFEEIRLSTQYQGSNLYDINIDSGKDLLLNAEEQIKVNAIADFFYPQVGRVQSEFVSSSATIDVFSPVTRIYGNSRNITNISYDNPENGTIIYLLNSDTSDSFTLVGNGSGNIRAQNGGDHTVYSRSVTTLIYYNGYWYVQTDHGQ